jgi:hypothetical protein
MLKENLKDLSKIYYDEQKKLESLLQLLDTYNEEETNKLVVELLYKSHIKLYTFYTKLFEPYIQKTANKNEQVEEKYTDKEQELLDDRKEKEKEIEQTQSKSKEDNTSYTDRISELRKQIVGGNNE